MSRIAFIINVKDGAPVIEAMPISGQATGDEKKTAALAIKHLAADKKFFDVVSVKAGGSTQSD